MRKENKDKHFIGNIRDFDNTGGWIVGQFMGEKERPLLETMMLRLHGKNYQLTLAKENIITN